MVYDILKVISFINTNVKILLRLSQISRWVQDAPVEVYKKYPIVDESASDMYNECIDMYPMPYRMECIVKRRTNQIEDSKFWAGCEIKRKRLALHYYKWLDKVKKPLKERSYRDEAKDTLDVVIYMYGDQKRRDGHRVVYFPDH
ncbi:hypothetical protein CONCODRAFT_9792 [Conidiobolus coronatus NRRL 28638]|uniref:Uncharacterized protein n=1 Tax=Conidiobolus coronatus (strain ATCC 28846 / CBS 209.66 / NRRL 28638) TaxID=796925 RepID=A0A137NZA3_CONC2|nr:hypothetical protein CONCODRAFT_9792 [Conidiobolus coronatus NRRL 28638]|eukprot:KXN68062.1 hypothetical protein CONCODRAFT_9792 [Conidiobolus coronatus NRRL 28638]